MIVADMGFETTNLVLDKLRQELKASKIKNRTDAKEANNTYYCRRDEAR